MHRRLPSPLVGFARLFALPFVLSWGLALGASGCRSVGGWSGAAATRPLHGESPPGAFHVVAPGETWAALAARRGVPLEDLLEINGVEHPGPLHAGQTIYLLAPERRSADGPSVGGGRQAALAFSWPLAHPVLSSPFGARAGRVHEGIDLAAPIGTPVLAAADGFVLYAGDGVRGYGNMVVVKHADELLSVYAHNSVLLVRTGDRITRGQEIARVGQSGRATAPHLHFEIRRGELPRDPMQHLPPLDARSPR